LTRGGPNAHSRGGKSSDPFGGQVITFLLHSKLNRLAAKAKEKKGECLRERETREY